jgi:3-oxoadipate enol-lactonase
MRGAVASRVAKLTPIGADTVPTIDVNGHSLFYEDDDFSDPWRRPEVVFMQPYQFGSHADFRAWVPSLARHHRVVRMDRLGLGRSAVPDLTHRFTVENIIDDFVRFLDVLGVPAVHYIGESAGGALGIAFAARHPDRVRSLVLCSTPCVLGSDWWRRTFLPDGWEDPALAVMQLGSWLYFRGPNFAGPPKGDEPGERALMNVYRTELRSNIAPHVVAGLIDMIRDLDMTSVLPMIEAPTLLVTPSESTATSPEEQRAMAEAIPNCEQVVLDAGHNIAWYEPDRCASLALAFIARHAR